ncbi:DUF4145 domain-containing protein [Oceanobacillus chungangensis]|uniref:Transposase n=1 Tax=Oceanobacillus chungangensis TaxID=1229152 RepID=A0A3D8PPH1_9BACI|nr:DUF4145 domain-containing protein [Oceanobacillus chungangensis]RDW18020.1 transposase [Oceanobacillus chungangensis]
MKTQNYYQFLEPLNKELALIACELENSIFTSPRTMLTHARVFVENILQFVMKIEKLPNESWTTLVERIDILSDNGYITSEICDALHTVRMMGNQAAHDTRKFRYSEALLSWESVYLIVRWYVETYGPVEFEFPEYQDPTPQASESYDISEIEVRLGALEALLTTTLKEEQQQTSVEVEKVIRAENLSQVASPGFTTIRNLIYKGKELEVPYFLRDAFLLPQRFERSETFLIRLGAEQQARIMSELPNNLEGLSKHVKRFSEKNEEILFAELKNYIEEEKVRRNIMVERPGDLLFFFKTDYLIITEKIAATPLTAKLFAGFPSLLKQLHADQIETVGQLPRELVILAKYDNVGVGTVKSLFDQIISIQEKPSVTIG